MPDHEAGVQRVSTQPGPVWNYVACPSPTQAPSCSVMDLDGTHQEDSCAAKPRDQQMLNNMREHCHLFSYTYYCGTLLQFFVRLVLFLLINHSSGIKRLLRAFTTLSWLNREQ